MPIRFPSRCSLKSLAMLGAFLACLLAPFPQSARADVTDDQVLKAINDQINYLLSQKRGNNWEPQKHYGGEKWPFTGGRTAQVLYALLYAGRSIDDQRLTARSPELRPALGWLCENDPSPGVTYVAAYTASALALIPNVIRSPEYRPALSRAAEFLENNIRNDGAYSYYGGYGRLPLNYNGKPGAWDNSNSQIGLLGVWAAQDAGIEIFTSYWSMANAHWRNTQQPDGEWIYSDWEKTTGLNMTTAGLASLYITTECTDMDPPRLVGRTDPQLELSLAWLQRNFGQTDDMYGLYGCERVGLASGLKYFGTQNWYQVGATAIVNAQQADGSTGLEKMKLGDPVCNTAYALAFLCRGRNPILFNKLEYHDPQNPTRLIWNARPRDLANLTRQYTKIFEKDFNWHVVNLQVPAEDWLDSPVLLITGSEDPHFTPADVAKFKTFVDDGGLIFSTADGATPDFTTAMKKYAAQIVDDQYEMRELPKDHYIFHIQYDVDKPPEILGMSNGIRELWIHSTVDLGASWQMRALSHKADWDIPANIYLYATGKVNSRDKFQSLVVKPGGGANNHNISLARLDYAGNWDPEPGAWPRMVKLAQTQFNTNLQISNVKVAALNPQQFPVTHMTGTAGFSFNDGDVAALRKYLDGGGTLLVDAGNGSDTFNDSFNKLAAQLYPKEQLQNLPANSPVITGAIQDGIDATTVDFRKNTLKRSGKPPLMGIQQKGRFVIIYSSLDLTSGLLGTNTWGIMGYSPESSQHILRNMLLAAVTK